ESPDTLDSERLDTTNEMTSEPESEYSDGLEGSEETGNYSNSRGDTFGDGEVSDNLTPAEILAHNSELLRQYYFATTIGKANDLLNEMIASDPAHEDQYRQTLADAKKDWDSLPSKERIKRYEEPAEDWIESLIRETPDANGNVREDYEYNERKEPTVADIANAIARPKIPSLENTIFLGTVNTIPQEGIDMAQANTSETEPTKNERGEISLEQKIENLKNQILDMNRVALYEDGNKRFNSLKKDRKNLGLTKEELKELKNLDLKETIKYLQEKLDNLIKEQELEKTRAELIKKSSKEKFDGKTTLFSFVQDIISKNYQLIDEKGNKLTINQAIEKIQFVNPGIDINKVKAGEELYIPFKKVDFPLINKNNLINKMVKPKLKELLKNHTSQNVFPTDKIGIKPGKFDVGKIEKETLLYFEEFRSFPYKDINGNWTFGMGIFLTNESKIQDYQNKFGYEDSSGKYNPPTLKEYKNKTETELKKLAKEESDKLYENKKRKFLDI
ncbi:MAG: hypothetical protein KDK54_22745, partial [Leptospiraceae bacterium]|nr:hypothetical protein [Leptospiraceae bacterium]